MGSYGGGRYRAERVCLTDFDTVGEEFILRGDIVCRPVDSPVVESPCTEMGYESELARIRLACRYACLPDFRIYAVESFGEYGHVERVPVRHPLTGGSPVEIKRHRCPLL